MSIIITNTADVRCDCGTMDKFADTEGVHIIKDVYAWFGVNIAVRMTDNGQIDRIARNGICWCNSTLDDTDRLYAAINEAVKALPAVDHWDSDDETRYAWEVYVSGEWSTAKTGRALTRAVRDIETELREIVHYRAVNGYAYDIHDLERCLSGYGWRETEHMEWTYQDVIVTAVMDEVERTRPARIAMMEIIAA